MSAEVGMSVQYAENNQEDPPVLVVFAAVITAVNDGKANLAVINDDPLQRPVWKRYLGIEESATPTKGMWNPVLVP
jgi:hypothetical protein